MIPEEIFLRIAVHLDSRSLSQAKQVCKQWNCLFNDDTVWKALAEKTKLSEYPLKGILKTWKERCQQIVLKEREYDWFIFTAERGNDRSMVKLARHFFNISDSDPTQSATGLKWLNEAAEKENPEALNLLGCLHREGKYVEQNDTQAAEFFQRAASHGHRQAHYNLAHCYFVGIGMEKNPELSTKHYEISALKGYMKAMNALGLAFRDGIGIEPDKKKALECFYEAAWCGEARALINLGDICREEGNLKLTKTCYEMGMKLGSPPAMTALGEFYEKQKQYTQAHDWYQKAAAQGEKEAMWLLGRLKHKGNGCSRNFRLAFQLYEKAADAGHIEAMNELCFYMLNGVDVDQNLNSAMKWAKKSASCDDPIGLYNLGCVHFQMQTYDIAMDCFVTCAENGDGDAMDMLGTLYLFGLGVQQDFTQAKRWFNQAEKKGVSQAINSLGDLYYYGCGVKQDFAQAKMYYEKAAAKGSGQAMNSLGCLFYHGEGVEKDYKKAHIFFQQAEDHGEPLGRTNIGQLHENGFVFQKSTSVAKKMYQMAACQGEPYATTRIKKSEHFNMH